MQGYTPVKVLETEAEQRRPDPRINAAAGYPPPRRTGRQQLGAWLISLGTRLVESASVPDPEPTLQEQY